MTSGGPSPKKKLMDKIFSGMSPGKRRVSLSQFDNSSIYSSDYSDDGSSQRQLSRRSSLRSTCTSFDLSSAYNYIPDVMPEEGELNELFTRFLIDTNLTNNEQMLAKRPTEKWYLIQAHFKSEQKRADNPLIIIEKMDKILEQMKSRSTSAESSKLQFLERHILESLKISFRTASVTWLSTFAEMAGCELMMEIMKQIYPERNMAGQQVAWMMEAVKTFSNCPFGIECFVQRPGLLETLVLFIDSADMKIKQYILHILTAIAYTNPNDGPYRILSAFSALQKALHEEDRFDCLLKMLENSCKIVRKSSDKMKIDLNLKFISDCLIFFNVLLEDIADFNFRVSVRCQILRDPFKREFERLESIGLAHQKSMFQASAQVDQSLFNEMLQDANLKDIIPREGCSKQLFDTLYEGLVAAKGKDSELSRLLINLLMIPPEGQLRSQHIKLLRKVLEAVLYSKSGLVPEFSASPIPLMALEEFVSCLASIDHRSRGKELTEELSKQLESLKSEKSNLEANLDEQINGIKIGYENELVKLKLKISDLEKSNLNLNDGLRALKVANEELVKESEELKSKPPQSPTPLDEDVPLKNIDEKSDDNDTLRKTRPPTPPPLPPTLSQKLPPVAPPLPPGFLNKEKAQAVPVPPPPLLPKFLQKTEQSICPPVPPPLPSNLAKSNNSIPPPPPPPPFLKGSPTGVPPPPPFMKSAAPMAPVVELGPFGQMPVPSIKLKPLPISKLSKFEVEGTFWKSLDFKNCSEGIFDLNRLERLLDASQFEKSQASSNTPSGGLNEDSKVMRLFDPRQSKNLSIMLRGIKLNDNELIKGIEDLQEGSVPSALISSLADLSRMVEDQNIKNLTETLKNSSNAKFDRPELIFIQLSKVEHWRESLALLKVNTKMHDLLQQVKEQVSIVKNSCKILKDAGNFFSTLGCILYLGNFTNHGTHRANAFGFRITSAKAAVSVRTTSKDFSVLDFLVEGLSEKRPNFLEFFESSHQIELARKISLTDVEKMVEALGSMKTELESLQPTGRCKFGENLSKTLQKLEKDIVMVRKEVDGMLEELKQLFAYYGEEYERGGHEAFLGAILEFCEDVREARKAFRERQLEAEMRAKRATAKPRQRSLVSQEHKHGFVDNIMDRLRGEIAAAAGRPPSTLK